MPGLRRDLPEQDQDRRGDDRRAPVSRRPDRRGKHEIPGCRRPPEKPQPREAAAGALSLLRRLGLNSLFPTAWCRKSTRGSISSPPSPDRPRSDGLRRPPARPCPAAAKVAYFQGCGMRMLFPEAAAETRDDSADHDPLSGEETTCAAVCRTSPTACAESSWRSQEEHPALRGRGHHRQRLRKLQRHAQARRVLLCG